MRNVRRIWVANTTYFITQVTKDRAPLFKDRSLRVSLIKTLQYTCQLHRVSCHAYVFLDDHLHALLHVQKATTLSSCMHSFKSYSAKEINRQLGRRGALWQSRFYDHGIRNEVDFHQHADYIHFNPVKHGYVSAPSQWPYSSFSQFVAKEYYHTSWGNQEPESVKGLFEIYE